MYLRCKISSDVDRGAGLSPFQGLPSHGQEISPFKPFLECRLRSRSNCFQKVCVFYSHPSGKASSQFVNVNAAQDLQMGANLLEPENKTWCEARKKANFWWVVRRSGSTAIFVLFEPSVETLSTVWPPAVCVGLRANLNCRPVADIWCECGGGSGDVKHR